MSIAAVVAVVVAGTWWEVRPERAALEDVEAAPRLPRISPDYAGIVVPPNIAPLNFSIDEEGSSFLVKIGAEAGDAIEIASGSPNIVIPPRRWRQLLEMNRGKDLRFEVRAPRSGTGGVDTSLSSTTSRPIRSTAGSSFARLGPSTTATGRPPSTSGIC